MVTGPRAGPCQLQATKDCMLRLLMASQAESLSTSQWSGKIGWTEQRGALTFIYTNSKNASHQAWPYYGKNITGSQIHQHFSTASNLIPIHNQLIYSLILPSLPISTFSCPSSSAVLTTVFLNTVHKIVMCWGRCSGLASATLYWFFNKVES